MEWVGTPFVAGSVPRTQYILVTIAIFGLQFVWTIEQTYVSLYLLELGLTKSFLSLIWIIGPACGLIVQPVVGVYSDYCTSHYGRRRPFMVWGAIVTMIGLVCFGWSREIAVKLNSKYIDAAKVAIAAILLVDIAVNVCQACCRALIVDMFTESRQEAANAWAGRMTSFGHLVSYLLGSFDLRTLGFGSQLKASCIIYSIVLLITVSISSVAVKERVLVKPLAPFDTSHTVLNSYRDDTELYSNGVLKTLRSHLSHFWDTLINLDPVLRVIFKVQLLAWYSWFTFLFYGATYASEVWRYSQNDKTGEPPNTDDMAIAGSLALTVFSLSSTIFTLILPKFKSNIVKIWIASFLAYALAMATTGFVINLNQVLILFGAVGFTWACTIWIPFALTAERIHELPLTELPSFEREPAEAELIVDTDSITDGISFGGHDEKSGTIMGIHNSAITIPQFISAFASFVIFQLVDKDSKNMHNDGGRAIAVTLQVGGFTALLAAYYAYQVNVFRKKGFEETVSTSS